MTTTNRIEDHHLKDGRGRNKDEPSNMQIMGSMLYTTFVRKIRALLLSLMLAQVPLIQSPTSVAVFISVLFLVLHMAITAHRIICARHEFAHIAHRMDNRPVVAAVYALLVPVAAYLVTLGAIVPSIPDTSSDESSSGMPAWIVYVTLLLIAVANFIASIIDDLIIGGLTDLYDEYKDDSDAATDQNVDSPAEDNADDSATTTHPSGSTRTATALSGFIIGYIFGRSHR